MPKVICLKPSDVPCSYHNQQCLSNQLDPVHTWIMDIYQLTVTEDSSCIFLPCWAGKWYARLYKAVPVLLPWNRNPKFFLSRSGSAGMGKRNPQLSRVSLSISMNVLCRANKRPPTPVIRHPPTKTISITPLVLLNFDDVFHLEKYRPLVPAHKEIY